jgi:phi13 family phage major tail protein
MAGIQVGLNSLYYAILTSDTPSGAVYNSPVAIAGAINAKINPKSNTETLYCDDGPDETVTSLGEIDVEFEAKDIDLDTQAALLGHTVVGGVLTKKSTDTAPYLALGFKSRKSTGKYRYVWLFKGKFALQEQDYQTQEDKPKFQTPKIKGTFIKRSYDDAWQKLGDEDHPDWVAATGTNWFTAVDGAAPSALTVSLVPTDGATGVAVGANLTWTFNNAIQVSDMTPANFLLLSANDGLEVAGALFIDTAHKVVTFNPSEDLDPSTAYLMVCTRGIRDIYGQSLAANSVGNFTTAA